jgi:hypothetical protein
MSDPFHLYHSRAVLIWPDSPFTICIRKNVSFNVNIQHSETLTLIVLISPKH